MADVRAALRRVFAGRPVILAGPALTGGAELVRRLGELGAGPVLALTRPGAAVDASTAGAAGHAVDIGGQHSALIQLRWDELLADPPADVLAAVNRFDPGREALVLVAPPCRAASLGDRPAFGPRRPEWLFFGDKLTVETLWDDAGLVRAPAVVVDVADASAAAAELDRGQGTVWSGDTAAGIPGGQFGARWVPPAGTAGALAAAGATGETMAAQHRHVRVMPFLPGRPCGIPALVLPSGVAVLRPIEHVTVRAAEEPRLRVVGSSSAWQPPPLDRAEIRSAASRVGALLAERAGYRGIVTIDGVLTMAGFRPTGCNAGWGATVDYLDVVLPELPLIPLHHALAADAVRDLLAGELEALLLGAADARYCATVCCVVNRWAAGPTRKPLVRDPSGWRSPDVGQVADAVLLAEAEHDRWLVRVRYDSASLRSGLSLAVEAVDTLAWLDRAFDTGIGPLRAGVDPPARLRPATARDTGQLAALRAASWQAAYTGIVDAGTLDAMTGVVPEWLADCCPASAGHLALVAEASGGALLGFVVAHAARNEPGVGEVGLLYVTPHAWGSGIGAALLAAAEEWFADTGHDAAVLWTFAANDRGRRFYQRCGWADDGGRGGWQVGAQKIPEVRYRRSVRLLRTGARPAIPRPSALDASPAGHEFQQIGVERLTAGRRGCLEGPVSAHRRVGVESDCGPVS